MVRLAALLPLLALGAAPPAAAPQPIQPSVINPITQLHRDCRSLHVANSGRSVQFSRLNELPPADAYQAVLRQGPDGCPDPLLVSERIRGR